MLFVDDGTTLSDAASPGRSSTTQSSPDVDDDDYDDRSPSPKAATADMGFDSAPPPITSVAAKRLSPYTIQASSAERLKDSPRTSSESVNQREASAKSGHRHTRSGGHIADVSLATVWDFGGVHAPGAFTHCLLDSRPETCARRRRFAVGFPRYIDSEP